MIQNSYEAELKREKLSLMGKIARRQVTIRELQHDERALRIRLDLVRMQLEDYKLSRGQP